MALPAVIGFTRLPSLARYLSLLLSLLFCACTPEIPKNTDGDFSTTHSLSRKIKKPLVTSYTFFHSETMTSPNSMGVENCRYHLQAILSLGYSHSFFLTGTRPIFTPSTLLERFYIALVSTRLGMTIEFWVCLSSPSIIIRRLGSEKTSIIQHLVKIHTLNYPKSISNPPLGN